MSAESFLFSVAAGSLYTMVCLAAGKSPESAGRYGLMVWAWALLCAVIRHAIA